jgi:hypothetical protein
VTITDNQKSAVGEIREQFSCLFRFNRHGYLAAGIHFASDMAEANLLRKDQLETSLHNERKLIEAGKLNEDNPLDLTEPFRVLCEACRRGDLKVCQEKITEGVNINARDLFDYTPLILVSHCPTFLSAPLLSCQLCQLRQS